MIYPNYLFATDEFWDDLLVRLFLINNGKPVILSEFGLWSYNFVTDSDGEELQQTVWNKLLNSAYHAQVDGVLGWMWRDNENVVSDETADAETREQGVFGIIDFEGVPKGAYYELVENKAAILMQHEPVVAANIYFNRWAYVSPLELFYSAANDLVENLVNSSVYPVFIDRADESPSAQILYEIPIDYANVQAPVAVPGDSQAGLFGNGEGNGAVKLQVDLPKVMIAGLDYAGSIRMQNLGTNVWQNSVVAKYGLGTTGGCDWPYRRWWVGSGEIIFPAGEIYFGINMNFSVAGEYLVEWQMLEDGLEWFGEKVSRELHVIDPPSNGARFIGDTVPDVVASSASFSVTFTVRNEGTETWSSGYALVPVLYEGAVANFYSTNGVALTASDFVTKGEIKIFSLTFSGPSVNVDSHRRTCWQMQDPDGNLFGQRFEKDIYIEGP